MTDTDALTAEQTVLQRKLRAREGKSGYGQNVEAIKARLAEIEKELTPE